VTAAQGAPVEARDTGAAPAREGAGAASFAGRRTIVVAVIALALIPIAVSIVRVVAQHHFAPNGDVALIELRVRDVGTSHTPLVGSYQRYGWNQPGPLLFYLYAIPYRLFASQFAGLQVGALVLAAASIIAIAAVAWRRGGAGLLLWSALLTAVLARGVPGNLTDPWEPHVSVLPLAALTLLTFGTMSGERWALPVAVGLGSLLAQAYANVAPTATALVVAAVVGAVVRARAAREPGWARAAVAAVIVVVVAWLPPLIDVVVHQPSNLSLAWDWLREGHQTLGFRDGYRFVALEFGVPAAWMGGSIPKNTLLPTVDLAAAPAVPIALLVLAAGLVASARRRGGDMLLAVAAGVAVVASIVGASRLVGPAFVWLPQPARVIGMVCWLAGAWCLYQAIPARYRLRSDRPLLAVVAVLLVAVVATNAITAATWRASTDPKERALLELRDKSLATARDAHGPILVRSEATTSTVLGGSETDVEILGLALVRKGINVVVERGLGNRFGEFRARPARAVEEFLVVVASSPVPAGYRLVASADPLTARQRSVRSRLATELESILPHPTLQQVKERRDRDPHYASLLSRFGQIPDAPPLALVARTTPA
jgi:hypothetical protein